MKAFEVFVLICGVVGVGFLGLVAFSKLLRWSRTTPTSRPARVAATRLLLRADILFDTLLSDLTGNTIVSPQHRALIEAWLTTHRKINEDAR